MLLAALAGCSDLSSGPGIGTGPIGDGGIADDPNKVPRDGAVSNPDLTPPPPDFSTPVDFADPRDFAGGIVEPLWQPYATQARVKSPGQEMHFTANVPFRFLVDGQDVNAGMCPPGHPPYNCPDSHMDFYIDGNLVGRQFTNPNEQNHWELRLANGLAAGDHVLTAVFTPHSVNGADGGTPVQGFVPVTIHVDSAPNHAHKVSLDNDLVLSGNTALDWSDTTVIGNGHRVISSNYTGNVTIGDSFVQGLGDYGQNGIEITTTGSVTIARSIFEATAPLKLVVNSAGALTITRNEFRSSNLVTYFASNPDATPVLDVSGNTTGAKVFQGNNVGGGIVLLSGMNSWQIGGLSDDLGNIFVGPRCVLQLSNSSHAKIQGNYLHHDYYGGWSQGFNLLLSAGSDSELAEHNVIRQGSWPVQGFGGEFRYNLLVESGHTFFRSSRNGASFHHNVMVHPQLANTGYSGVFFAYSGENHLAFYNNTIDVAGATGHYDAPAVVLGGADTGMLSFRNNALTQFSDVGGGYGTSLVSVNLNENLGAAKLNAADYNAWWNPLAPNTRPYLQGIVAVAPGGHDVKGDPMFAGPLPEQPYQIDEGKVWLRQYGVSQVLSHYRGLYTPGNGSPLIDSGDPGDGVGVDVGAVGAGTPDGADQFGKVMRPSP